MYKQAHHTVISRRPDDGRADQSLFESKDRKSLRLLDYEPLHLTCVRVCVNLLLHVHVRVCLCRSSSPCAHCSHVLCVAGPLLHKVAPFPLSSLAGIPFSAAGSCPHCRTCTQTHTGRHEATHMQTSTHGDTKKQKQRSH